jgi:hypothetical protein
VCVGRFSVKLERKYAVLCDCCLPFMFVMGIGYHLLKKKKRGVPNRGVANSRAISRAGDGCHEKNLIIAFATNSLISVWRGTCVEVFVRGFS